MTQLNSDDSEQWPTGERCVIVNSRFHPVD